MTVVAHAMRQGLQQEESISSTSLLASMQWPSASPELNLGRTCADLAGEWDDADDDLFQQRLTTAEASIAEEELISAWGQSLTAQACTECTCCLCRSGR